MEKTKENRQVRREAPGKINLHLRVKGLRADGYHALESIFLALDWGDTLRLDAAKGPGTCELFRNCLLPQGELPFPPEQDLVYRAAVLFRAKTGFDRALRIELDKRIPLGAGLGGGSSDAAAVLLALDQLAGTGLSQAALRTLAEALGSDVPFFLSPGAALVHGRGEELAPLDPPENIRVVLVNPGFPQDTAEAFRLLDLERGRGWPAPEEPEPGTLAKALSGPPVLWPYGNDFLPLFLERGPGEKAEAYRSIILSLKALGAEFTGLSGSGSTCFGIFTNGGAADRAVQVLGGEWNFVRVTFPLARSGNAVLQ
ncbi:MAG: 4-(cytidine 5'-diphospho)-2-C-methyl-D-erythritol kinase [Spirochaetaceae bacterium]|jgi:4-diphosphocytidyl-2-C-methyl-D-erythritol kinase|nr:4-(cytidine 5'-diphospho)-2-C-methyl-D-erythritol kinase [Spirochaetaceae bacterium]